MTGTGDHADPTVAPRKPSPASPSKGGQELTPPRTLTWHLTHLYVKVRRVGYSSTLLNRERAARRRTRRLSLPLLGGVQFFFQWHRDYPFARLHFPGQRVFHNIRPDDVNVSRQVLQHAFHSGRWGIEIHQEVPATKQKLCNISTSTLGRCLPSAPPRETSPLTQASASLPAKRMCPGPCPLPCGEI